MTTAISQDIGLDAGPLAHIKVVPVLLALAMGGFAIGTTEFAAMSLLPYIAAGLQVDEPTASHAVSAYALGVVVGAPLIAVFAARFSRRLTLIWLMAAFALANILSAMAPSYGWLLLFRFISGLPHGAYFGVAALVAASLVPQHQRTQAVAKVMLGLTVANIIGVPVATALGQALGWRFGFAITGFLALVTCVMVFALAPRDPARPGASPLRELGALRRRQVWLTLAVGAVGFGGIFAVYAYTSTILLEVTMAPPTVIPIVMAIFGVGMTLGTLGSAWAADRALMPTAAGLLIASVIILGAFPFLAGNVYTLAAGVFLVGVTSSLGTVLQTRLMDVAQDAQTLAAALNHGAFNVANALGPWLGGMAILAGFGFTSVAWVGAGLSSLGLVVLGIAVWDERRSRKA
ncbi:MFS transporter [Devosia limi]|uniref:MFS transporter, DHA1 family, arabinose polymer transporter n=1 Tax=Devosia limi DSM 17137 TaxID=1121477 RepID=A0A1M4YHS6_9HYPH|nr:MFS transporter [Devosia limi]SHF05221.1 MFS transporter, DHA1 family, arabinose polymer transporter [Devosia limi DSM 17137]